MPKTQIIDLLGEKALLLPALLNAAVAANERAKYIMALLQMAAANADNPSTGAATLRAEREACGIADPRLDRIVARSEALGPGVYHIPESARLIGILGASLEAMLAPTVLIDTEIPTQQSLADRKKRLIEALPHMEDDVISRETITALTSGRPTTGDSTHLLVMDLHKEINRLQQLIAEESIEGAQVYGLAESDRPLIAAFMRGVRSTAALKFDHPGLATTAARSGGALLIQNDIGETDAHVLVLRVSGLVAILTYTDVHAQRLRFFQQMLAATGIEWEVAHSRQAAGLADDDLFYVLTGKLCASDEGTLQASLERLGSRIVFLIDWNRARKRLRQLIPNSLAVELLEWAAEQNFGHRAFLQLGGERLVFDALEQAVRTPLRYGEQLHEMIGLEAARDYLRFVLETSAVGLRDGRSEMLIRDRVRAELFDHFRSAQQRLLAEGERHAAIIARLAQGLRDALRVHRLGANGLAENAERAKELESQADEIVRTIRTTVRRITGTEIFRRIVEIADDAADELEDAAFFAALTTEAQNGSQVPAPLVDLAELVLEGAQSFCRVVEAAPFVHRGSGREPAQRFLEAVDRLVAVEHQSDIRERDVTAALMRSPIDCREMYLVGAIAGHLEEAADALLRAGLTLRDHILGEVMFE